MASSSQGNRLKPKDDNPNDVLSMAGAAGRKPTTQFSAPRCDYKVDSNDQIIIDQRTLWNSFIEAVVLIYMEIRGWKQ